MVDPSYVFASIGIAAGLFFFLYATKYYISILIVLRNHKTMISNHNYLYNNHNGNNRNNRNQNNNNHINNNNLNNHPLYRWRNNLHRNNQNNNNYKNKHLYNTYNNNENLNNHPLYRWRNNHNNNKLYNNHNNNNNLNNNHNNNNNLNNNHINNHPLYRWRNNLHRNNKNNRNHNHINIAYRNHLNNRSNRNHMRNNEPFVSIHLPLYNEPNVVDRLLETCTSLDYQNYEVIVLDDSTDNTTDLLRRWSSHPRVKVVHRTHRKGYKPGALQEALKHMSLQAEYVLVLDADFVPPPYLLNYFVPYFDQPEVAREDILPAIMDLDHRFVKGEITTHEYLEQKERLVKIVEKVPKKPVDERSLVVATAGLDQLFIRKEIENGEYQKRRETFIEKLRKKRETPRTREAILSIISDLNMSYAKKEISHEEYRRKRLELIKLLREMERELPKEVRIYSSILELDQLFAEDKISVEEYIERRRKLAVELEAATAVKAGVEEEMLVELVVKPTEKDLKTLMKILKLDSSFVTGKIGAEEYLEERQRLVGELETLKKIEERRKPKPPRLDLGLEEKRMYEEGLEAYPIFELDRAFTEERIKVEEYLKRRKGLVESIYQQRRSRYDIKRLTQLYRNHNVAAVQSYQHHLLNSSENWLTRGIRVEYSESYMVERSAQESLGLMKMIAGSVFLIRADLLREFGWSTSITEDWELTLRLYLDGYKVLYTPLNAVPAECPSTIKRLVQQRMRWSEGHTYNVRKYFRDIMTSPNIRIREKLEFLYYAPYYLQSFLFILGTLCWLISEYLHKYTWGPLIGWFFVLYNLLAIPAMAFVGLFLEGTLRRDFTGILSILSLTYILAPFQAYASMKGLLEKKEGRWIRTFKTGKITERFALLESTIRRRLLSRFSRGWRLFLKRRMRMKKRAIGVMPTDERSVLTTIYELDRSFSENQITTEEFISERHKLAENLMVMKRRRERRIEAKKPAKDRTAAAILELDNNFIEERIGAEEYLRKRTSLVEKLQEEAV